MIPANAHRRRRNEGERANMAQTATDDQTGTVTLFQITRDPAVVAHDVSNDQVAPLGRGRRLTAPEVRRLVEELVAQLPASERQAFRTAIKLADMI
jgi:DNA-directed RNA polymerase specialized sigma24 family protein